MYTDRQEELVPYKHEALLHTACIYTAKAKEQRGTQHGTVRVRDPYSINMIQEGLKR